jgi:hypothetical protein
MLNRWELAEISRVYEKWGLRKGIHLNNLDELEKIDFSPVINAFVKRLETIPCKFSHSEEVSGAVCFFGGVVTSLLNFGYIEEIEGLFTFALCYMLIDHYLDDNTISAIEKKKSMKDIYKFIVSGEENSENKLINAAADRYLDLVERVPSCKQYILKLFKAELKGVEISNRKDLSREEYSKIDEEKGGLTAVAIGSIIGVTDIKECMKLGHLIQIVDNLLDIQDDTDLGIYTLARYDLDRGSLDRYIFDNVIMIDQLSNIYNFFKVILLTGLILGIHDNPHSISENLHSVLQKYNIFSSESSKNSLNTWFHEKLYSYIEKI